MLTTYEIHVYSEDSCKWTHLTHLSNTSWILNGFNKHVKICWRSIVDKKAWYRAFICHLFSEHSLSMLRHNATPTLDKLQDITLVELVFPTNIRKHKARLNPRDGPCIDICWVLCWERVGLITRSYCIFNQRKLQVTSKPNNHTFKDISSLFYQNGLSEMMSWISNYTNCFLCDVITYPWPHLNGGLAKPPLKSGHRGVIASHSFIWRQLLIPATVKPLRSQVISSPCVSHRRTWRTQCVWCNITIAWRAR